MLGQKYTGSPYLALGKGGVLYRQREAPGPFWQFDVIDAAHPDYGDVVLDMADVLFGGMGFDHDRLVDTMSRLLQRMREI